MTNGQSRIMKTMQRVLLLSLAAMVLAGCKAEEKKPAAKPIEPPKQEEVFADEEDEAAKELLEKVRAYAENFEVGGSDGDFRKLIKANVPQGSLATEVEGTIHSLIAPLVEEKLKEKVEQGLREHTQSFSEQDVEYVLGEMNTGDLIAFVVAFEIERLVMEGYLR